MIFLLVPEDSWVTKYYSDFVQEIMAHSPSFISRIIKKEKCDKKKKKKKRQKKNG